MNIITGLALALSCGFASSLNIIINNDDGWATANIREFYKALKVDGHNAFIVAPVEQQSGQGGRTVFSAEAHLSRPGQWNTVPAGALSFGTDPMDSHIWYYNGTPAAVTFFALDYLVRHKGIFGGAEPDLIVTGPNEGSNAGPFLFTLSGTIGAAYAAVGRGIPAVAFSATNILDRKYTTVNSTDDDPAAIVGKLAARVVKQLADKSKNGSKNRRILPYAYGININFPYIGVSSLGSEPACLDPTFVHSRLTGGATTNIAVYDEETGLFSYINNFTSPGVNTCINGDCLLPGETDVIKECKTSISVFTVDYDAPTCGGAAKVRELLDGLVENPSGGESTKSVGTETGDATSKMTPIPVETGAAERLGLNGAMVVIIGMSFGAIALL
ncbi:Exopolyphosphatase [Drechslerella dactyloides]|uniref:Exopolyphosphatase n=1 Tax=Drechslerella dactyloides TaxID=74499 RepID=A0AAD6J3L3_DREDA|nr:Exopolyphosphatase [Drechslerella dactyloides]